MERKFDSKNKILIITYYWPPSGGAGVQRWVKFAKYLPQFGFEPIILTVDPKDATYLLIDESLSKELDSSLEIHKTPTADILRLFGNIFGKNKLPHSGFSGEKKASFLNKILRFIRGNFFIPDARIGWNKYAYVKAKELIVKNDIKFLVTTSPPHSTQLIGLKLKKNFDIHWVADLRDPWVDIYFYKELMHTFLAKWIDARYERNVLLKADKIIVVSDAIKCLLDDKTPERLISSIAVIPNGYDEADIRRSTKTDSSPSKWTITYTGNLGFSYPGAAFLKVLRNLIDQNQALSILFRFVGVFPNHLSKLIDELGLYDSIEHVPYVPHDQVFKYLNETDALFLAIPEAKNNEGILTGKLFEYLASQKPILCIGPVHGDAAKIIQSCETGQTFEKENGSEILIYLQRLVDAHKEERRYFTPNLRYKDYSRENLTKELSCILNTM